MEYHIPKTLEETFSLLKADKNTKVIAGGTDLAVVFSEGYPLPDTLVDITRIPEISDITEVQGDIVIGAGVTAAAIACSDDIPAALREGAAAIGSPQIRNMATIGGNICNASPCGDTLSPLVALNARFLLTDGKETREVPAEDFFTGPKSTVLEPGELVTSILIPKQFRGGSSSFRMIGKRNGQVISQVNCALWMVCKGTAIENIRICFGSVAPVPLRCRKTETLLQGAKLTKEIIGDAARLVREEIAPIDDVRATQEYRLQVAEGMFRELIQEAAGS